MDSYIKAPEVPDEQEINPSEGIHFLEPFIVLAKRKRLLIVFPLSLGLLSAVISLLLSPQFTSTAKVMPPQQSQSIASAMLGQLGSLAGAAGKDLGLKSPSDLYISMLKSRSVGDALIEHFSLMKVYKAKRHLDAEKQLDTLTEISAGKDGVISISVTDKDPIRAADLANSYIAELQKLSQTLAITEAGRRRLFFEGEVRKAGDELASAEENLRKTQESTGIIQLDSQSKAMIEALTTMHAQLATKEAEVEAMTSYASPENPDLIRARKEISTLRSQLSRMDSGQGMLPGGVGLQKVPEAGLEYVRRLRELKYRESVLELLTKQYEIARIDEGRDASIIQVLDKAYPPEVRSWPNRSIIVLTVVFLAFMVAIVLAFVLEASERAHSDPQFAARWQLLKFYLFGRHSA
jgi:uncharacterized protein involved in exopolysaccharide biosynthesis